MSFVRSIFDPTGFYPRWECGQWSPFDGWLMIASDVVIFLSYMAIPAALAFALLRRRDVPFPGIMGLFVAFIMACGITHAVDALMFYYPIYRLLGLVKAITGVVSFTTAIVLIQALPGLLSLPSIKTANEELRAGYQREIGLREDLERARTELELRTATLSQRSWRLGRALTGTRALACQWESESGQIEWEIGYDELATELDLPAREFRSWSSILDERNVGRLRDACAAARECRPDPVTFETPLAGAPRCLMRLAMAAEPEVRGEPATMVGLARIVDRAQP